MRPVFHRFSIGVFLVLATEFCTGPMLAESVEHDQDKVEEIIVWGRASEQKGLVGSASEGLISDSDFSTRVFHRVGEMVEMVPGMVATQHSGAGKANQYFLRGMNLDHGTDFSAFFEGMPVNFRAHAHGQGYLDLNFLIPELVRTVQYNKGPYRVDRGDFSTAGSAAFSLYDRLEENFAEVTVGDYGYRRGLVGASTRLGSGDLLGAYELTRNDGPWDLAQRMRKHNVLMKYSEHGRVSRHLTVSIYDNEWRSTDQIPKRLTTSGRIGRFGYIDPDLGGQSKRVSVVGNLESDGFVAGIYLSRYELNLFGNFTHYLEDPVEGDEHEQEDRRWTYGGRTEYKTVTNGNSIWTLGMDIRVDDISAANLFRTTSRARRFAVREDAIQWASVGMYTEIGQRLNDRLRATLGVRADHYRFDVDAQLTINGGKASKTNFLPKFGLAYEFSEFVELYANYGTGFHSNDVRGVTIRIDPVTQASVNPIDLFVDQVGYEIGARVENWRGLNVTGGAFWLESDSELLFVGDSGSTVPNDASRRRGLEVALFQKFNARWVGDLNMSFVDSEFVSVPSGLRHIPNAHGRVVGGGFTYVGEKLEASVRFRHFGDAPLSEDNQVREGSTTIVNASFNYTVGRWEVGLELDNLFNREVNDIAYYYETRLADELEGVDDVMFHPIDPVSARATLRISF